MYYAKLGYADIYHFDNKESLVHLLSGVVGSSEMREGITLEIGYKDAIQYNWDKLTDATKSSYPNFEWFKLGLYKTEFHEELEEKHNKYVSNYKSKHPEKMYGYKKLDNWLESAGYYDEYHKVPDLNLTTEIDEEAKVADSNIEFGSSQI